MTLSRRKMLGLIGGGTVLAAAGSASAFLTTRTAEIARRPWTTAGQYTDLRMRALSYALLAPNPHNRQPWLAELVGTDTVVLFRNPVLNLPETDPLDRQLTIGMGCFLELLVQAAAEEKTHVELQLFPEGTGATAPVAVARFGGAATPDPLFTQVLHRHTNRFAYEMDSPPPITVLNGIIAASVQGVTIAGSSDPEKAHNLRRIANKAVTIEAHTPRTHQETIDLTRIGKAEINANPDGISLGGAMMDSLALVGLLDRTSAADPASTTFAKSLDFQRTAIDGSPGFFWLTTQGNSRIDQITAGRSWVRAHLKATELGLSVQPLSQALQEYPEMAQTYRKIHTMLAPKGGTVQMLGRLGVGKQIIPAPRWPLETRLHNA